jgi:peptidoglycan/LPS O-acetylase OafA/YrhL
MPGKSRATQVRVPELDGLRGIAIILVVLFHSSLILRVLPQVFAVRLLGYLFFSGWLGVDVFFVLSGFLITRILLSEGCDWKRFYRNRAFRILPAFLVVFVLTLSLSRYHPWLQVVAYLFFMGNFTILAGSTFPPFLHLWSLAVEEQFYLIWPQAAWRISRPALLKIALSLVAVSILCRFAAAAAGINAEVVQKLTPAHLDGIALGGAVAIVTQLPSAKEWLARRWRAMAWAALSVLAAGAILLRTPLIFSDIRVLLFAIPAVSVLTATLVFAASEHQLPSALSVVLRSRILTYFGARSYGLYLIHWPTRIGLGLLRQNASWELVKINRPRTFVATEICAIALAILLAEASWRLVEQPAQRLKRRWFERKAEPSLASHP